MRQARWSTDIQDFTPKSTCNLDAIGAAIASIFTTAAPAAAATTTAAAPAAAATTAAALAPEVVTVTAPELAGAGITAGDLAAIAAPAAAGAAPFIAGAGAPAVAAPGAAAAPATTQTTTPSMAPAAVNQPSVTAPVSMGPTAPTAGPAGGAVSSAAPSSVQVGASTSPAESLSSGAVPTAGPTGAPTIGTNLPGTTAAGGVSGAPTPTISGTSGAGAGGATGGAGATTAAGGGGAAAAPTSLATSGIVPWLKSNAPLIEAGAGLGGLGLALLRSNQSIPGESQIASSAQTLANSATQLQSYLNTGTLPPGIQTGINQAAESAKASIRSFYASIGDTGSSAEAQSLASVDSNAVTQGSQIAISLLQQGVSEQGMADQLYQELMNTALTQDQQLGSAIASFATSLVPLSTSKTP